MKSALACPLIWYIICPCRSTPSQHDSISLNNVPHVSSRLSLREAKRLVVGWLANVSRHTCPVLPVVEEVCCSTLQRVGAIWAPEPRAARRCPFSAPRLDPGLLRCRHVTLSRPFQINGQEERPAAGVVKGACKKWYITTLILSI